MCALIIWISFVPPSTYIFHFSKYELVSIVVDNSHY